MVSPFVKNRRWCLVHHPWSRSSVNRFNHANEEIVNRRVAVDQKFLESEHRIFFNQNKNIIGKISINKIRFKKVFIHEPIYNLEVHDRFTQRRTAQGMLNGSSFLVSSESIKKRNPVSLPAGEVSIKPYTFLKLNKPNESSQKRHRL